MDLWIWIWMTGFKSGFGFEKKKLAPGFDLDLSNLTGFGFDLDLRGWWICTPLVTTARHTKRVNFLFFWIL